MYNQTNDSNANVKIETKRGKRRKKKKKKNSKKLLEKLKSPDLIHNLTENFIL